MAEPETATPDNEVVTPDPIQANRDLAAQEDQGPDVSIVECPSCHSPRRAFLIVDGKCDSCRLKGVPSPGIVAELGWPEVRQRRNRMIQSLDWTQLGDIDDATRQKHADIRTRLRDVTTKVDAQSAWLELDSVDAAIAAA